MDSFELPASSECSEFIHAEPPCFDQRVQEALVVFVDGLHVVRLVQDDFYIQEVAEVPKVLELTWFFQLVKLLVVPGKYVPA